MDGGYNSGGAVSQAPPPPKYDNPGQPPISQQPYMGQPQPPYGYNHPGYMPQPGYGQQPAISTNQQVTVNVNTQPQQTGPRTWSTTLCGCMEDFTSCCCVMHFCPCYTSCYLAPKLGESCCAPLCLAAFGHSVPMVFRTKMRAAHGIMGGSIDDCTSVLFCMPCVMCQIKREIDYIERSTGKPAFL